MLHSTPTQDTIVESSDERPIRSLFKEYETTFIILHPFLVAKQGCDIKFERPYPNKKEIINCASKISWQQILHETGLEDIKQVDRLLGYLHCARRTADKTDWQKLMQVVDTNDYGVPQVDWFPEIIINDLFASIKSLGYSEVKIVSLMNTKEQIVIIDDILKSDEQLPIVSTITTLDNKILIATKFDEAFSYISSTKKIIDKLIKDCDLEGFFCNADTKRGWSYIEQIKDIIDWNSKERYPKNAQQ